MHYLLSLLLIMSSTSRSLLILLLLLVAAHDVTSLQVGVYLYCGTTTWMTIRYFQIAPRYHLIIIKL